EAIGAKADSAFGTMLRPVRPPVIGEPRTPRFVGTAAGRPSRRLKKAPSACSIGRVSGRGGAARERQDAAQDALLIAWHEVPTASTDTRDGGIRCRRGYGS